MIYAVNKRTKEHRVVSDARDSNMLHEVIIQADADGWIKWSGGENPLPDNQRCEVKDEDGEVFSFYKAIDIGDSSWREDITAYRPILEKTLQPLEWNGEGLPPVGSEANTLSGAVLIKGYFGSQVWYQQQCGGDVVQIIEDAHLSPMPTKRDRWIEAAHDAGGYNDNDLVRRVASQIYDALKSGELPQP